MAQVTENTAESQQEKVNNAGFSSLKELFSEGGIELSLNDRDPLVKNLKDRLNSALPETNLDTTSDLLDEKTSAAIVEFQKKIRSQILEQHPGRVIPYADYPMAENEIDLAFTTNSSLLDIVPSKLKYSGSLDKITVDYLVGYKEGEKIEVIFKSAKDKEEYYSNFPEEVSAATLEEPTQTTSLETIQKALTPPATPSINEILKKNSSIVAQVSSQEILNENSEISELKVAKDSSKIITLPERPTIPTVTNTDDIILDQEILETSSLIKNVYKLVVERKQNIKFKSAEESDKNKKSTKINFSKTVSYEVSELQRALYKLETPDESFPDSNPLITGKYDQATVEKVKEFQIDNNLSQDGVVGPNTIKTLNRKLIEAGLT